MNTPRHEASLADDFPPGFLWGAATSGYQIEGGASADGKGRSIWDVFAHTPGKTLHGDTGDVACSTYDRSRLSADLDLMRDLGLNAYVFSVQWPRIQPDGRGAPLEAGLDYYRFLVDGLRERGIEPLPTLYHWELPQTLQRGGGWRRRSTAQRFAAYADAVHRALGDRVRLWITQNEPHSTTWLGHVSGSHAPGLKDRSAAASVAHHLLLSHGLAAEAIHARDAQALVGVVLDASPYRPASPSRADERAARRMDAEQNQLFFGPLFEGRYPPGVRHVFAEGRGPSPVRDGDLATIARTDFLGVNYYAPRFVAASAEGPIVVAPPGPASVMGWAIDPEALGATLQRVQARYTGALPLLISENGISCRDEVDPAGECRDPERIDYLERHIAQARASVAAGVPLKGYIVWSLLDNFEWNNGYRERFGLVHVDYRTQHRTPKASYRWLRERLRR